LQAQNEVKTVNIAASASEIGSPLVKVCPKLKTTESSSCFIVCLQAIRFAARGRCFDIGDRH
jgi:hypothetical protein